MAPGTGWRPTVAERARRRASIRLRITAVASAVVAVVLVLGAALFVVVLQQSLRDGAASSVRDEASAIADRIHDSEQVTLTEAEVDSDRIIQIVQDGTVVGFSDDAEGLGPLLTEEGESTVTIDGDEYLVVSDSAGHSTKVVVARELSDVTESLATVVPLVAISIPALVALLAITTWIVVGRALRPVERMREEVDKVTASRLDRRLAGAGSGDELGRLASTMNRMLDRLDQSQRSQQRFISDASHELKSPLASLRQYAEVARTYPDRMTAAELAEAIEDEGGRLERIVRGMLVLARADEGSLRSGDEAVDLDDLVLPEVQRLRASTGLAVEASIEPARVRGDAGMLGQVVRNLVDNAARHARSSVVLTLSGAGVLTVEDDGAGIPESERERVFERFVRLDEARGRDAGGSGLGLAIVREIVAAHGGTVTVDASAHGGARFTVTLPA